MRFLGAKLCLVALVLSGPVASAETKTTIKDFYGSYVGVGATRSKGTAARDRVASLRIAPTGDGFRLTWSTTMDIWSKEDRRTRSQSLTFRPAGRLGRWRAVQSGDPFAEGFISWARLHNRALVVYVVTVDPASGELKAAIWRRTLTSKGLTVRYDRLRDTSQVRGAFAWMERKN
jgi:hypothetical protein